MTRKEEHVSALQNSSINQPGEGKYARRSFGQREARWPPGTHTKTFRKNGAWSIVKELPSDWIPRALKNIPW